MFCSKCGQQTEEDSKFCQNCGVKIKSDANVKEGKKIIEEILEAEEIILKSMPMRFVPDDVGYDDLWVKDILHFTNKRLIWNIKEKGVFSKKVTFDDMPYKAIHGINKNQSPKSGGFSGIKTMFKKGGTVLVMSAVGSREFQFDDEDSLRESERLLRQILIGE